MNDSQVDSVVNYQSRSNNRSDIDKAISVFSWGVVCYFISSRIPRFNVDNSISQQYFGKNSKRKTLKKKNVHEKLFCTVV